MGDGCAAASVVVCGRGDGEDGDDLRYAGQDACDGLSGHDGLCVFDLSEAGDVGEDAVLTESCGQAGGEDDGHEEAKVYTWRYTSEENG